MFPMQARLAVGAVVLALLDGKIALSDPLVVVSFVARHSELLLLVIWVMV